MRLARLSKILIGTVFLTSCGTMTYSFIAEGVGQTQGTRYNVKHVKDGCCGCSGILVNSFLLGKLQSQLFIESNGCPFAWTKFNFHYSENGNLTKVDTLIAVADSNYQYPITDIDKLALVKVDSFIATRNPQLYHLRKIDIKGYRNKTQRDSDELMVLPPRLSKTAYN